MEPPLYILAGILAPVAIYLYLNGQNDLSFAAAVFAFCSAFLGYRFRLKARVTTVNKE